MYKGYVLISQIANKTYIGYTTNMERRIVEHNETGEGFTKRYRPWTILSTENYTSKSEALKREKYLKTGKGREEIKSRRFYA